MNEESPIKLFNNGEYKRARTLWENQINTSSDQVVKDDILFNIATCYASENNFNEASSLFVKLEDQKQDVLYNLALCNYKCGLYNEAESNIEECMNMIIRDQPGLLAEDSHSKVHQELDHLGSILLVQSINLKAAICFKQKDDCSKSLETLKKIPLQDLSQFDCVSLHNTSIYESEISPEESIRKLHYLVNLSKDGEYSGLVPPETFMNLLMLSIYERFNDRANIMIQNEATLIKNIDTDMLSYFRCCIESENDQVLYDRLERLAQKLIKDKQQNFLTEIICSQQASLLWNGDRFEELEEYLLKMKPYFTDLDAWTENMAHSLFMQDTRYEECSTIYEEMMMSHSHLSEVNPVILCNLCISYILSGKNNSAEALIKEVESLEADDKEDNETLSELTLSTIQSIERNVSTLTLINLAIGTLYCVKCNYDFGLGRIIRTLTPLSWRLTSETWLITKTCILSLIDSHCRQTVYVQDHLFDQVVKFLVQCERVGQNLIAKQPIIMPVNKYETSSLPSALEHHPRTVTHEARLLRSIVVKIFHD